MPSLRALSLPSILFLVASGAIAGVDLPTQRALVKQQMALRPFDPWPRGAGHVVYAWPGSKESEKGYEEPGGSLSPAVRSFGISFWVLDSAGKLLCTSDSIPLDGITQRFAFLPTSPIPDIITKTRFYTATWSLTGPGRYVLHFRAKPGTRVVIALRSVGPAGGPVKSISARAHQLTVNDHWHVTLSPGLKLRAIGHEGGPVWTTLENNQAKWHGSDGWGYALLNSAPSVKQTLIIAPANFEPPSLRLRNVAPALILHVPDSRFEASLNAQTAHLMMGLVGHETRPGEPTNYPLSWLRDGAYAVVALARAGQLDVAKQLASYFADHDFFGGFGPEADAPGLSLWAIGEISTLAKDPLFDAAVFPSVERKTEWIRRMRRSTTPIYEQPFGPIVPIHAHAPDLRLVAEPARDGLIIGRMDWERPLLFVNAVSFAGITQAAAMADRLGRTQQAGQWRDEAASIQAAWERALPTREHENERTYVSTLWPTAVGARSIDSFTTLLEQRWNSIHNASGDYLTPPLWTYFDVADAHQWLMLHRSDRVWQTLSWFFDHQSSPGLYTWGEGTGEENTFGGWEQVRGWTDPKNVTPHYWTAAEMLLLQLDMLAHVDVARPSTVVIGDGIRPDWRRQDMKIRGLLTELGTVDWSWHNGKLTAVVHHGHPQVVAGGAFGTSAPLKVIYLDR